jgi:hypothetical protein
LATEGAELAFGKVGVPSGTDTPLSKWVVGNMAKSCYNLIIDRIGWIGNPIYKREVMWYPISREKTAPGPDIVRVTRRRFLTAR